MKNTKGHPDYAEDPSQAPGATPDGAPDRRLPIGAELLPAGGVHFRVWAPQRQSVVLVMESQQTEAQHLALAPEGNGYFTAVCTAASAGTRYRFRLDEDEWLYPDPASRFQPDGPHGPSEVIDPSTYRWQDSAWNGITPEGLVIYELHIGTFTKGGTWGDAELQLASLARMGINVIEVMPVAEFPGRFGWGYDGVDLFAPTRLYGRPDDVRHFVDAAHCLGIAVILDVVYNHLGPDGNYLNAFSPDYFTDRYENEWGAAINFDGSNAGPVREFFVANAGYWIDEYHMDGLRLDATQSIHDASDTHVLTLVGEQVRARAAGRGTIVVSENEPQNTRLVRARKAGGYGLTALWNDDFHHTAKVAATGSREAYYHDYLGAPQELVSAVRWGYLYQGQRYSWQKKRRGLPGLDLPATAFINYLDNHDQVANSGYGARFHELTTPGRYRALTALLLLAPGTPMLFQGQEFGASSPFHYFADHKSEMAHCVRKGRREFLTQFPSLAGKAMQDRLPAPEDPGTFESSKLDQTERETHATTVKLHAALIGLRRSDPVFSAQDARSMHGAVIGPEAFCLRFVTDAGTRLVIVNLGRELRLESIPEPLVAPPADRLWKTLWSSDDPEYGGTGIVEPDTDEGWQIPAHSCQVLTPGPGGSKDK